MNNAKTIETNIGKPVGAGMCELDGYGVLLTVEEVAELLCVSTRTVYRFAKQGELPCVKVGHRIYFTRTAMAERLFAGA